MSGELHVPTARFVPDFRLRINGTPAPSVLRASITALSLTSGLEGADRLELTLVNNGLRWLDNGLFALDTQVMLDLGYADVPLEQMFGGEIVAVSADFPQSGLPTVMVTAQDARHRLSQGAKVRWFAVPVPSVGNFPLQDVASAAIIALENQLVPIIDPISAAISVLLGGVEAVATIADPGAAQKFIRKQANESDYQFLARLARENGWEMVVDHSGSLGGHRLHFFSPLDHLDADVDLAWGESIMEFAPRISNVGQILSVAGYVWVASIKTTLNIKLSWDWDRMALTLAIDPEVSFSEPSPSSHLIKDPMTLTTAPRRLISELLPKLNRRMTATGMVVGDPHIIAGNVLRIRNVGVQFGGLWRVTEATHTLDSGGYRTRFQLRKEIWFGSIPGQAQGAVPVRVQF